MMNTTQTTRITIEIRNHLMLIGLNRAAKRNAFDSHMIDELSQALTTYEDQSDLRCAVIYAHGEHFTAGLDLVELQPRMSDGIFSEDMNLINPWGTTGRKRKKPVVVAVKGYCFTAGIELMLNADICIAHQNTQFTQLEVQRGILPFGGATSRFVKTAGWSNAMRYLLTGDFFDAATAYRLHLITEVTEQDPLDRAIELAESIASAAPLAVQATLTAAQEAISHDEQYAFDQLKSHLLPLIQSEDAIEGMRAMSEKRQPRFKGQ